MSPLATTVADKITAAKLWLTSAPLGGAGRPARGEPGSASAPRDLPYLESALHRLIQVASTEVQTMSVDQHWRLYVREEWVLRASVQEIGAELAHLLWHLLREHSERAASVRVDSSTAKRWHRAADAALHGTLHPDDLAPRHMPSPQMEDMPAGLSAEDYFTLLTEQHERIESLIRQYEAEKQDEEQDGEPEDERKPAQGDEQSESDEEDAQQADTQPPFEAPAQEGCGSGCDGLARSWDLPLTADVGNVDDDDAREIRRSVAIAYREHVTTRGTDPGDAWRWSQEILEPTVAWEPLLASAVRKATTWTNGHTHYTYQRRSRRQAAVPDVLLPGARRPVPRVAIVIDTSGSVDDVLLARALGEVEGVLRSIGVAERNLTVLSCDAAVHTVTRIRKAGDVALAGGGGTDLRVGIAAAENLRPRPQAIIVFTDGYTPWPQTAPDGVAVVVALLVRDGDALPVPPPRWAKTIVCRL